MLRHLQVIDCLSPAVFCDPLKETIMLQDYHPEASDRSDGNRGTKGSTQCQTPCRSYQLHMISVIIYLVSQTSSVY